MSCVTAPQIRCKHPDATKTLVVSFDKVIDTGVLLTGTPTVDEEETTDLIISNIAINSVTVTVLKKPVAAGRAVLFSCAGGVDGVTYSIKITVSTDGSPTEIPVGLIKLLVTSA